MIPERLPSNGVPWLIWFGRRGWQCQRCGELGQLPDWGGVAAFARVLTELKIRHHRCGGGTIVLGPDEVGHPLNPDRAER